MHLREQIYRLRTARGLSQEGLAERLGVSRQSVSKWETGAAVPDLERLMKLCDLFGVSLDELTGRTAERAGDKAEDFTAPPPASTVPQTKIVGYILLGVSLLGGLLLMLFQLVEVLLLVALPMLVCSILCLSVRRRAGYWCLWVVWMTVTFFLFFGVSLRAGGVLFPWVALLLLGVNGAVAWHSFRDVTVRTGWARGGLLILGWAGYVAAMAGTWLACMQLLSGAGTMLNVLPCLLFNGAMTAVLAGLFTYSVCFARSVWRYGRRAR